MDATQANAEPTNSEGMDAQASRSLENDGTNNETVNTEAATATGLDAEIASVDSPEALAALTARLAQAAPSDEQEPAATAETTDTSTETSDEGASGDGKAAGDAKGDNPQGAKRNADEDEDDEEDGMPLEVDKLPTRARLHFREDDEVGRMAANLKKRNKDMTLEECVAAARKKLGKEEAPASKPEQALNDKPAGDDVAKLEAQIKELREQKKSAARDIDLEKVAELDATLDDLRDKLLEAKVAANAKTAAPAAKEGEQQKEPAAQVDPAARADYDAKFDASLSKARTFYPDIDNADSAFARRMAELDGMLKDKADPLFHSPDKPFRVAAMVAAEMGVAPKNTTVTAKPAKQAAASTNRTLAPIASGESRTTTTRTQGAPTVAAIQGLSTPDDLENFLAKVGGGGF